MTKWHTAPLGDSLRQMIARQRFADEQRIKAHLAALRKPPSMPDDTQALNDGLRSFVASQTQEG